MISGLGEGLEADGALGHPEGCLQLSAIGTDWSARKNQFIKGRVDMDKAQTQRVW